MENTFGVSPEVMERAKKMGQYYAIEIRKNRGKGLVEVRYVPTDFCMQPDIGTLVDELADGLAWGHQQAFGMHGTIVDTN
jgi:hypothetical protein